MGVGMASGVRGARRYVRNRRMSEINVTPFVDVMLVLLIIFMVAAPLLNVGVPLKLPETSANPLPAEQEQPLTISIDAEGRIYLQELEVPLDELIPKLRAVVAERTSDRVFVRGDLNVSYGVVARVMGALNAAGLRNIGLVTDQAPPDATTPIVTPAPAPAQ